MRLVVAVVFFVLLVVLALVSGCASEGLPAPDGGDAGRTPAGRLPGSNLDGAEPDAGSGDVPADVRGDRTVEMQARDAGDVSRDLPEAGSEISPDTGPETSSGIDAGSEPGRDAGPGPGPEAGLESGSEPGVEPGRDAGPGPGPEAGLELGPEAPSCPDWCSGGCYAGCDPTGKCLSCPTCTCDGTTGQCHC